jgi:L-seryl-tRNA(Ser) seleniumtransferase
MSLRDLPSVDRLLAQSDELVRAYGRPLTTQAYRDVLEAARAQLRGPANGGAAPTPQDLFSQARARLAHLTTASLRPVINATGVIIHTNLGRAPLSAAALAEVQAAARGYSNLEYDLDGGERGSRSTHVEGLLTQLTGAEAALVVNNNAAALLLMLAALAQGQGVVIARSQLVEIGGGFRVPDVMKQSGARLVEVGTTNRVNLDDYRQVLDGEAALVLHAHRSNFKLVGFVSEPGLAELAGLGRPLLDDLGSGTLLDTAAFGLAHEPMVQESLTAGSALVCFSGDKLLGGPQAGIVAGRRELVDKLKRHPLARAVRADKLCLAALSATLQHYLRDEAVREIPVWRMIAAPLDKLDERARAWAAQLRSAAQLGSAAASVVDGESTVGGGSLPGETLPTRLLALDATAGAPNALAARLRAQNPPIVARVADERVLFDPRTVMVEEEAALLQGIGNALTG